MKLDIDEMTLEEKKAHIRRAFAILAQAFEAVGFSVEAVKRESAIRNGINRRPKP